MTDVPSGEPAGPGGQRLDKWLWFARVTKSRTLAATLIGEGKIKVNKVRAEKPSQIVKPGDVITSSVQRHIRILRVVAPGTRRGPAAEAAALYEDLTPPPPPAPPGGMAGLPGVSGLREPGAGRPTKRDRRMMERLKGDTS